MYSGFAGSFSALASSMAAHAMSRAASGWRRKLPLTSIDRALSGLRETCRNAFEQLAPGGDVHGRAVGGEQPDVGVFLTVRAAEQDHGHLRAQAFGDGKAAGFADDQIRCRHKRLPCPPRTRAPSRNRRVPRSLQALRRWPAYSASFPATNTKCRVSLNVCRYGSRLSSAVRKCT